MNEQVDVAFPPSVIRPRTEQIDFGRGVFFTDGFEDRGFFLFAQTHDRRSILGQGLRKLCLAAAWILAEFKP